MYYIWNREDENTEYYIGKTGSFIETMNVISEKVFEVGWRYSIIKVDNYANNWVIWYHVKTKHGDKTYCFNIEGFNERNNYINSYVF